ncbi:hypothetical protein SI65_04981 [Aspergillus cristatus]|uniref:Uncharacterized protein n=1 Tax=Aspergillus cristatus TaxID=573508 RepID=A0A1E3BG86_ASPCR|nr:hypothetical protein SI65_04981 [Aspergillus cristatus]
MPSLFHLQLRRQLFLSAKSLLVGLPVRRKRLNVPSHLTRSIVGIAGHVAWIKSIIDKAPETQERSKLRGWGYTIAFPSGQKHGENECDDMLAP